MSIQGLAKYLLLGRNAEVPERNILMGYLVYIVIGFGFLMLPLATRQPVSWVDNLFTAASALSTTGLATVDIPAAYTLFGQGIILLLIQIGALGYMTLTTYLIYRLTHHNSMSRADGRDVVSSAIAVPYGMSLHDLVDNIIHFTLIFELIGFISFYITLSDAHIPMPAWKALFLSVSSFCTAGFSPFPDSLCMFRDNLAVNITVAVLSYAGAMGFIFITDLRYKLKRRGYSLTFTSKVIILITGIMTISGTVILALSDIDNTSQGQFRHWLVSFFQTMSAMTTVGYNTIDLSTLAAGPILVFSLIMFVGASPSGTGGGVKCTSVSAVWGFIMSRLGLRKNVTFMGRIIPRYRLETALSSVVVYGIMIFAGCVALCYTEPFKLSQILFEATSAIGTVGLSTGITAALSTAGKCVIIILMFVGRVGVITFGSAILAKTSKDVTAKQIPSDLAI